MQFWCKGCKRIFKNVYYFELSVLWKPKKELFWGQAVFTFQKGFCCRLPSCWQTQSPVQERGKWAIAECLLCPGHIPRLPSYLIFLTLSGAKCRISREAAAQGFKGVDSAFSAQPASLGVLGVEKQVGGSAQSPSSARASTFTSLSPASAKAS